MSIKNKYLHIIVGNNRGGNKLDTITRKCSARVYIYLIIYCILYQNIGNIQTK